MHRCFVVEKILVNVVTHVHADEDGDQSLYALAMTCKAFRDPALDMLWRVQMSLGPLIKCLPADLWEETLQVEPETMQVDEEGEGDGPQTRLQLKRAPMPSDWRRAGTYAARIRALYHKPPRVTVSLDVFRALRMWGGPHLLPNLRELHWLEVNRNVFPYICLFVGPRLVHLRTPLMNDADSPNGSRNVVTSLRNNSPHLVKVDLINRYHQDEEYQADLSYLASDLICRLSHLQEVFCGFPLTPEAILHLSVLPNLRVLDLYNLAKDLLACLRNSWSQTPFVNIANFTIRGDMPSCTALLRFIRPFQLESLCIHQTPSPIPLPTTTHQLLLTLKAVCSHSVLTSVQIYHSDAGGVLLDPESHLLTFRTLETLCIFKNLSRLDISLPVSMENAAFHQMALNWPLLEELNLGTRYLLRDPRVSLVSLFPLSTHCLGLERLRVMLRVSVHDIAVLQPRIGQLRPRNYTLTWLDLAMSFCDPGVREADVAAILSDLFPNLDTIFAWTVCAEQVGGNPGQRWVDMWQNIESHLEANLQEHEEDMELGMEAMFIGD